MKYLLIIGLIWLTVSCKLQEDDSAPKTALVEASPTPKPSATPTPAPELVLINSDLIDFVASHSRNDYPVDNTLDKDANTFATTYTLALDEVFYIAYLLPENQFVTKIKTYNNYTDTYTLGDLEIFVSQDSTNGINGNWTKVNQQSASYNDFLDGDSELDINSNALWIKLVMTYTGSGAHGTTPAFYLSEIQFYGTEQ